MGIKRILQNRYLQLVLVLLLGITIGALFYPTKTIEERVEKETSLKYDKKISEINAKHSQKEEELRLKAVSEENARKTFEKETSKKLTMLTTENRELRESSKKKRFKLVKPDGTIIEREYEETNSEEISSVVTEIREEFDEKIKSTEEKWKKVYKERLVKIKEKQDSIVAKLEEEHKIEIEKLKSEKTVRVNEKSFRLGLGYTSDKEFRIDGSYTLWGPFSIGSSVDLDPSNPSSSGEVSVGVGFKF